MSEILPRWLSLNDISKITGLSRTMLNNYRESGSFPEPVEVGERRVAWVREEVEAWMASYESRRRGKDRLGAARVAA